jgi:hypothetical protein
MIVVEDCAHAVAGSYKGRKLGTIGAFGLYSMSKFAFCYALGAITTTQDGFASFVAERQRHASIGLRLFINGFKLIDERNMARERPVASGWFDGIRGMAYARYGDQPMAGRRARALWWHKRDAELAARRDNYRQLRVATDRFGICDHLETEDVVPYAVPLAINGERAVKLVNALNARGIKAGVYRFDFARCVFEPDYRPCVLIPIHAGMAGEGMDLTIETISKSL